VLAGAKKETGERWMAVAGNWSIVDGRSSKSCSPSLSLITSSLSNMVLRGAREIKGEGGRVGREMSGAEARLFGIRRLAP